MKSIKTLTIMLGAITTMVLAGCVMVVPDNGSQHCSRDRWGILHCYHRPHGHRNCWIDRSGVSHCRVW